MRRIVDVYSSIEVKHYFIRKQDELHEVGRLFYFCSELFEQIFVSRRYLLVHEISNTPSSKLYETTVSIDIVTALGKTISNKVLFYQAFF